VRDDLLSALSDVILLLVSAAVHEAGHLLAAKLIGVPFRRMKFCTAGGVITFDFSGTSYLCEAFVHLGGSLFGMASALICYAVLSDAALGYLGVTVMLSAVNLLPVRGLDGGAVLSALLNMIFLPDTAERITAVVSFVTWAVIWCAAVRFALRGSRMIWPLIFAVGTALM